MAVALAFLLDYLFGEVKRYHPLVGFGHWAQKVEQAVYTDRRQSGFIAWALTVLPIVGFFYGLNEVFDEIDIFAFIFSAWVLYVAIGRRSLIEHAEAIFHPLQARETLLRQTPCKASEATALLDQSRTKLSYIVSRDTASLGSEEIISGATESVLENGADAIFAAVFWFLVAGVPGVVLYRLSNTLDAMWGYKNTRYQNFGYAAAKIDDALNYIPARLTAVTYCLLASLVQGSPQQAFRCWQEQAGQWKSPNAGAVMAAGAGALQISLGGSAIYHGRMEYRPLLGFSAEKSRALSAQTVAEANKLINYSCLLCIVIALVIS